MEYKDLTFEEFEKKIKSVKYSKAAGHDNIDDFELSIIYDFLYFIY